MGSFQKYVVSAIVFELSACSVGVLRLNSRFDIGVVDVMLSMI